MSTAIAPRLDGFDRVSASFPLRYEHESRRERIVVRAIGTASGDAYKVERYVAAGPHARKTHAESVGVGTLDEVPDAVSAMECDLP